MSMTQLPLTALPHRNNQLFSDHYLNTLLPSLPEWSQLLSQAQPIYAKLQQIYASRGKLNEAQTEQTLIMPTLQELGHIFGVQSSLRVGTTVQRPDYIFYASQTDKSNNSGIVLDDTRLKRAAYAVGDAKAWDVQLDKTTKKTGSQKQNNTNPSYQIDTYIRYSGLDWGILTNGRLWRLYHRSSSLYLNRYYEVDLPALLDAGNLQDFLYFYAFFRRDAFQPGPLSLDTILQNSTNHARQISDNLKEQVFTALRHIAQGFLDDKSNKLQADPQTLKQLYDNSLIILYRLLFIFYAEARDLLPLKTNHLYRTTYSLDAIKRDTANNLDSGQGLLRATTIMWPRLKQLFQLIDKGDPALDVPTFNGGLFDDQRYPFLQTHSIGDARLQQAIDQLARIDKQFIDYRDLQERHLGTIYEGLLEYHLEAIKTADWDIDLRDANGERHRTGSYYTPDYIVQYIVAETIQPLLDQIVTRYEDDDDRLKAILSLNICDPSCGSGHFLVATTEYIARFILSLGIVAPNQDPNQDDLSYWKRRVVQSCIYGVDLNPLAVELTKLSLWLATVAEDRPLSFLDHHIRSGNSLVGTRIAAINTQTVTKSAKRAARKQAQAMASGQMSFFSDPSFRTHIASAVGSLFLIEENPALTIDDIKQQEQVYNELREILVKQYRRLADLTTAIAWGQPIDTTFWKPISDYVSGRSFTLPPALQQQVDQAEQLAKVQAFFHWELEFPEVFFDRYGQERGSAAGFDAVIGNPPYVRQEQITALKPFLQQTYPETYHGAADLYTYFYHQGLRLLRQTGYLSYIVTNKWLRSGYGEGLRGLLAAQSRIVRLIDFGHAPIFADAEVFPCIILLEKTEPDQALAANQIEVTIVPSDQQNLTNVGSYVQQHHYTVPQSRLTSATWSLETAEVEQLLTKIRQVGVSLIEFTGVQPYYGIKTGYNQAFLVDEATKQQLIKADPRSAELLKPYLRGQDISRWASDWDGRWIILLKSSENQNWPWSNAGSQAETIFAQSYPAIYQHLKQFETALIKRQDQGRFWWELRSCAYYDVFEVGKIITQDLATYSWFCYEDREIYPVNTCYIWPTSDLYVLAWLCSPIAWWIMHHSLQKGINDTLRMFREQVEQLPIAVPSPEIRTKVEAKVQRLIAIAKQEHATRRLLADWLRLTFTIDKLGQELERFTDLDEKGFIEAVQKRQRTYTRSLSMRQISDLQTTYQQELLPVIQAKQEASLLERELADLIYQAYQLTDQEKQILLNTAPPRMPIF